METQKNRNITAKSSGKTWTIAGSIIAAVCIIIYLFALVQGILRIYLSVEQRKITAEQEFSGIADLAYSAGLQGFMNDRYIQTMNDALIKSESIEAFIITGADIGYAFDRQEGNAITWVNNQPRFVNKFGISNQDLYKPLPFTDVRNANIKAVAGSFDYVKITDILRQTLLIILAGFAIAFFTMLLQFIIKKPAYQEAKFSAYSDMSYEEAAQLLKKSSRKDTRKTSYDSDLKKSGSASGIKETRNSDDVLFPPAEGLYSQRSGIGWEEYIKDRLDSEIHRCSSAENDLVFILMNFNDITDEKIFKTAADEAVSFFSSRDLLFEYGQSGIAAIIPGIDLEKGISKSEKFYQRVTGKLPGSSAGGLRIGMSSRAGRLLNADRMLLETREALKRAGNDPSASIIAFKSDPEKYREYIRNRS